MTGDAQVVDRLKQLGCVDLLVATLEAHPSDQVLLEIGATSLGILAGEADLDSSLAAVAAGGVNQVTAFAMGKVASLALVPENISIIVKSGGIMSIIAAVKSASEADASDVTRKIIEAGCRTLMRLATDEQNIYAIMQARGVRLCVSVLKSNMDDVKVVSAAIGALARMVTRKENAEYIVKCGGLDQCLAALKAHPDNEAVVGQAMEMLSNLAAHEATLEEVVKRGGIQAVVQALKNHMDNRDLVSAAVKALGRMANSAENFKAIADAGGLETLVEALNAHVGDEAIASACVLMLETAAMLPENLDKLRECGAMDAILAAMEAHPKCKEIQESGGKALGMIAGEEQLLASISSVQGLCLQLNKNPGKADEIMLQLGPAVRLLGNLAQIQDNSGFLVKNGSIDALSKLFLIAAATPKSEERDLLLASTAQGLARLAKNSADESVLIVKSGAFAKIMLHARSNIDNEVLVQHVLELTAEVASVDEAARELVGALEIGVMPEPIQNVIEMVRAHPLNEQVLASGAVAIGRFVSSAIMSADVTSMSDEEKNAHVVFILKGGAAEVMVESIMANIENEDRLLECLKALPAVLISDPAAAMALVEAGGIRAIVDALRQHADNAEIVRACLVALGRMCVSEDVAEAIGKEGAMPLLVAVLRDHYTNEDLIQLDVILLDTLAIASANVDLLLEEKLNTVSMVEWAIDTFKENEVIQESATHLLNVLNGGAVVVEEEAETKMAELSMETLTEDRVSVMLQNIASPASELQVMQVLNEMAELGMAEETAVMLVEQGGLQQLATVMLSSTGDEDRFKAAAVAFQRLAQHGGPSVLSVLEQPKLIEAVVELIKPHQEFAVAVDPTDLSAHLEILGSMAGKEVSVQKIIDNGALVPLSTLLCTSNDPNLLRASAHVLAKMSNSDDAAEQLAKSLDLRALILSMRNHLDLPDFLKYAVYLLANIAIDDHMKEQIGIEGGIQVIIVIMNRYEENQGVIDNCCYALANLSVECETNVSFIVACKGIDELVKAMNRYPLEVELLDQAITALGNLCVDNDNNARKVVQSGGARAIVTGVLDNINSDDLMVTGFNTLGQLGMVGGNVGTIIKDGAVQAIVAGMTVHSKNMEVIDVAILVLTQLAADLDDANMAIMAAEGAVQAIVEVATEHTQNERIEIAAFGCLTNFARKAENGVMIIRQGGLKAGVATLKALGAASPALTEKVVSMICTLSYNESNADAIVRQKAAKACIVATQRHPQSVIVLQSALAACAHLAYSKQTALKLAKSGAVEAVLVIIKARADDMGVLTSAFQALSALCRSEENAINMSEAVMNSLVFAIRLHFQNPAFVSNALAFLSNMCVYAEAAAAALKTDMVRAIITALQTLMNEPPVLLRGIQALENMALASNELKDHLQAANVIPEMEAIRNAYKHRDDIASAAQRVIEAIQRRIGNLSLDVDEKEDHKRKLRSLFEEDDEVVARRDTVAAAVLSKDVRNLLVSGALLIKHSNTAVPRPRYVFVTPDLKWLCWKDAKKPLKDSQKMKVYKLRTVEYGRCTPQLQRKKAFGGYYAKEECAFAVLGRERTVDLECSSEAERDKWAKAFKALIDYNKAAKKQNTKF
eukprot:TRINITY_DN62915_c0_g1_i1.p1 TRINITY_DN62915_c0_g1~~TRINITY_DN62915_c0_g1_i1.p1  ORF type:complete len:1870 (+),score=1159.95 TRINITY_DN62915_c0_g1_i1:813-5612(+)